MAWNIDLGVVNLGSGGVKVKRPDEILKTAMERAMDPLSAHPGMMLYNAANPKSEDDGAMGDVLPPPPTPENAAPQIDNAVNEQRKAKGRAATMLTGGRGLLSQKATTSKRVLLGA